MRSCVFDIAVKISVRGEEGGGEEGGGEEGGGDWFRYYTPLAARKKRDVSECVLLRSGVGVYDFASTPKMY